MVTEDFTEAVYRRFLQNIASEGRQANRDVVSLSPPLLPARAHFNSLSPNGVMFPRKGPLCKKAAIQN